MIRSVSVTSLIAASFAFAPAAFAKPVKTVEHFKAGKHRHVTEKETIHTKTGVIDFHTKITKVAKGVKETKTISEKETPVATGYSYSKTVKGFDGKTTTTTGTVASAHASTSASASASSSSHGGKKG